MRQTSASEGPPINDLPYKADIEIRYRNEYLPKKNTSSMFPENWDLERIQQEVAWVYENTVAKGINQKIKLPTDKFSKYEGITNSNFKIRIEVDESGNIMNAYPINF